MDGRMALAVVMLLVALTGCGGAAGGGMNGLHPQDYRENNGWGGAEAARAVRVVVATGTRGPDYAATQGAIEIEAAGDRAAGEEAYRLAGEAELERERALGTIQAGQATGTAEHGEMVAAMEGTRGAELHGIAAEGTREAIRIGVAAGADRATRQAGVEGTAEAEQDAVHAHQLALAAKKRKAEMRAADLRAVWGAYIWPIVQGGVILAICWASVYFLFQLAMAGKLVDRIIAFSSSISGHWEPVFNGTAYPAPTGPSNGNKRLADDDGDLLQLLIYATKVDCFTFDRLAAGGYPRRKERWVELMARLQGDGWVMKVGLPGAATKWVVKGDSRGRSVGIHEILTSYRVGFQTMSPPLLGVGVP